MTTASAKQSAKEALRTALAQYDGDPKHEAVADAIATLAQLNPTSAPARNPQLRDGHWLLISAPNFPGGQRLSDGTRVYSLGRIAFNMFQPQDLQLKIDRVWQPVLPLPDSTQRTHDIRVEFSTVSASPLQGVVTNRGICEPSTDDSIQVQFTGGVLAPQSGVDLQDWNAMFGDQAQRPKTGVKDTLMGLFLQLMFGLVAPQGMNQETGEVTFTMKRSPKGKLQILYLDETLRITKGEKGTVLVCERQPLSLA